MPPGDSNEITILLRAWSKGNPAALERLVPLVDRELRAVARRHLASEPSDSTLDTTALVNEAYLRLIERKQSTWQNRVHFYAIAAKIIRHILVDHARARRRAKRGSGAPHVDINDHLLLSSDPRYDLQAIDEALRALAKMDPRKAQVVELRFFGGLTIDETAEVLRVSPETVRRDWRLAKAWLMRELTGEARRDP